jgi:hypothetical protein
VNSAEENRGDFFKGVDGRPIFSALYGMYAVTLNNLKAVLEVSVKAGQSGAVSKPQWNQLPSTTTSRK